MRPTTDRRRRGPTLVAVPALALLAACGGPATAPPADEEPPVDEEPPATVEDGAEAPAAEEREAEAAPGGGAAAGAEGAADEGEAPESEAGADAPRASRPAALAGPVTCHADADCPHLSCGPCEEGAVLTRELARRRCAAHPCPGVTARCDGGRCVSNGDGRDRR
jgi:predicted small lipoprotein YifL